MNKLHSSSLTESGKIVSNQEHSQVKKILSTLLKELVDQLQNQIYIFSPDLATVSANLQANVAWLQHVFGNAFEFFA